MTVLTDTQVVTASGGLVELGYATTGSSDVTSTATTFAGASDVFTPLTVVSDGSPLMLEFYCRAFDSSANSASIFAHVVFNIDGVDYGWVSSQKTSVPRIPANAKQRVVLSAGSHTVNVRCYSTGGANTITIANGAGGAGAGTPSFLRVSKIVQATQWPAVTTGSIICTSSTRPASPFAGQQIYETDTSKSLIYSGSVWQPPWNTAWGSVAAPATWGSNSITSTSTADTTLASVTFVAVAGRRYRTSWIFDTYCGAGYGVSAKVKNGATAIATVAYASGGANQNFNLNGSYVISGLSAGSCTINLTGNSSVTNLTYYGSVVSGQFAIEDVGPA